MLENKAEFISSLIFGIIVLLAIGFISGCAVSALILNDDHLSLIMQLRKPKKGSAEQTSPTVNMLESDILDNAEEGTYIAVDNGVYDKLGKNRPHAPIFKLYSLI
ncbi:hypothetical protein MHBO_003487 [Bonamia ostreae]|uniref:Uncharacterized protein n=1 Tax=Bonamia ostreae TaxID=126728 RepID=A0ABV2AQK5_9EUKA